MLTKTEALELVAEKLRQMSTPDNPFVVADEGTIEKPYGWVFFFNSKNTPKREIIGAHLPATALSS